MIILLKDFCDTLEQGTLSVVLLNTFAGVIPLAAPRVKSLAGLNDGSLPGLKENIRHCNTCITKRCNVSGL